MSVLVGLDVGTGGAHAVAVDEGGGVVAEASLEPWEVDRLLYNHLEDWQLVPENTEGYEVWRERDVASLLGEEDHVAAAKTFYIDSIRQLKEVLTTFKKDHPDLPWQAG